MSSVGYAVKAMTERLGYSLDEAGEFLKSAVNKYDSLSPAVLAEHCVDYTMKTGKRLVFIVDENRAVYIPQRQRRQNTCPAGSRRGLRRKEGSVRLIVTSQEKLDQLIANRRLRQKSWAN
ncbi:hypothetical protein [Mesotoga sp.]|uniref:hypothetical protein n=1 Tax=Mesotoga sp. TaxID=2053577 RepID=UPI00345F091E